MKRLKWFLMVLAQELKMKKIKSIVRYGYDAKYRSEINALSHLLSVGVFKATTTTMTLGDIHFSHDVSYSQWVFQLVRRITSGEELAPIKVIYNPKLEKYVVVDGNHRLMAYKLTLKLSDRIPVRVLHEASVKLEQVV